MNFFISYKKSHCSAPLQRLNFNFNSFQLIYKRTKLIKFLHKKNGFLNDVTQHILTIQFSTHVFCFWSYFPHINFVPFCCVILYFYIGTKKNPTVWRTTRNNFARFLSKLFFNIFHMNIVSGWLVYNSKNLF